MSWNAASAQKFLQIFGRVTDLLCVASNEIFKKIALWVNLSGNLFLLKSMYKVTQC